MGTGYVGDSARDYDNKRFTTLNGKTISSIETKIFISLFALVPSPEKSLEIGCGTGRFTRLVANKSQEVVATDISPDMLKIARKNLSHFENISFERRGFHELGSLFSQSDFVYGVRVINQMESEEYVLEGFKIMSHNLKPNSFMLLEFVNKDRPFAKKQVR
jgi:ubiquinone/menaquinone biosynthesis C-methylase UbiE